MTPQAYTTQGPHAANQYHHQQQPTDLNRYQQQQIDPALIVALKRMKLHGNDWHMDTSASSHMASDPSNFHTLIPCSSQSITVRNSAMLSVAHTGSQTIPSH
jgi:hypothetical protein